MAIVPIKEVPDEVLYTGTITVGGKDYPIAMNLNTVCDAEDQMGDSMTVFSSGLARAKHVRALVYAALREGSRLHSAARVPSPQITKEFVGSILSTNNMAKAVTDIMLLLRKFRGESDDSYAPFVPTPPEVVAKALEMIPVKGLTVMDLGCGTGTFLKAAANEGAARCIGFENDEDRNTVAEAAMIVHQHHNPGFEFEMHRKNLREADVSVADVLYIYLLQDSNQRIKNWLAQNMHKGAVVISHDFTMDGWVASRKEVVATEKINHTVTVYEIGDNTPPEVVGQPLV